jgi:glycosyltransferase involved in cell wall biosynthesis
MRIVQLIDSLRVGGAEKLQVTFMQTALSRGLQPTIITFNCHADGHLFRQLEAMGVRIIEIKGRNLFDPVLFMKLVQILRNEKIDILHTHLTYAIILGGLAGYLTHTPVVASIHNLKPDSWPLLEAFALRFLTNRRIAVGTTVAKKHQTKIIKYPIDIVLNPVELVRELTETERLVIRATVTSDTSRLLLITVGRLLEAKGYDDLLIALDRLRRTYPKVVLAIIGAGPYLIEIEAKIKTLKLEDHVCLLGVRSDVSNLLAASDLYVSASHSEGLPVSVLEAMAAGLPVVATNVGDIPLVVKPEFGICVPAHQPAQLAKALQYFLENPDLRVRFGVAARDYVTQMHSSDLWFDQILNIYNQVIDSRNNIKH